MVKLGEIAVTSGIDITGEGWQPVGFDDFGKCVLIGAGTYLGTKPNQFYGLQKNSCKTL